MEYREKYFRRSVRASFERIDNQTNWQILVIYTRNGREIAIVEKRRKEKEKKKR